MSEKRAEVALQRDCDAILVPQGQPIILSRGTPVSIYQQKGGSVTVIVGGNMVMIQSEDIDALGLDPDPKVQQCLDDPSMTIPEKIWHQMSLCYDPEIPVNVVDLGLIYNMVWDEAFGICRITMTLTAPACGMGPVLVEDIKYKVAMVAAVRQVEVDLVFDPPWDREMMSESARLTLNML